MATARSASEPLLPRPARSPLGAAALGGLFHALVDAATVGVVYAAWPSPWLPTLDDFCLAIVVYNALAFGLQLPLGIAADRWRLWNVCGVTGIALACAALILSPWLAWATVVLAGLGNALFHVGGGGLVLGQMPDRAAGPGLFIAPGTLGLAAGVGLGQAGLPGRGWLALALAAAAWIWVRARPDLRAAQDAATAVPVPQELEPPGNSAKLSRRLLGLLSLAIAVRSFCGEVLSATWRSVAPFGLWLALAACAGKAVGGFAADRVGWRVWAVSVLLAQALMSGAAPSDTGLAVLSMAVAQMTAAVTLAALGRVCATRPATAFGLASGVLLVGVLPEYAGWRPEDLSPALLPGLSLAAAALLFFALPNLRTGRKPQPPPAEK